MAERQQPATTPPQAQGPAQQPAQQPAGAPAGAAPPSQDPALPPPRETSTDVPAREPVRPPRWGEGGPAQARPWRGHVIIEVGDEHNRSIFWKPTEAQLRGAWESSNMRGDEHNEITSGLPASIPGMRIEIDGRRGRLRIFDPLNLPEFKGLSLDLMAYVKEVWKESQAPAEDYVEEDEAVSDTRVKTWLHWARRLVNGVPRIAVKRVKTGGPQAKVISGDLPSLAEIAALPGKTEIGQGDRSAGRKYLEHVRERLAALGG